MSDTAIAPAPIRNSRMAGVPPRYARPPASGSVRRLLDQLPLRGAREPRVARVFDGCNQGRPLFDAQHPMIVDAKERKRLLALLQGGAIVLHSAAPLRDEISGEDGAVSGDLRSDGVWIWSDAVAHYLENHWIAPDPDLVAHLAHAKPLALTAETWGRLYAALLPDSWEGTTWPLD